MPDIPEISGYDLLALDIWQVVNGLGLSISEAIGYMGLELNTVERYFVLKRLMVIKSEIDRRQTKPKQQDGFKSYEEDES